MRDKMENLVYTRLDYFDQEIELVTAFIIELINWRRSVVLSSLLNCRFAF